MPDTATPDHPPAETATAPAIRVDGLSKCYRRYARPQDRLLQSLLPGRCRFTEFWALREVSFDVARGETLGVIGANGAGKSTLLQLLSGTLTPTEGSVQVAGRVAALLELGAGFDPDFSGRENVYLNAAILGLSRREIDARFQAIADFAEIGAHLELPVRTYSSGMAMRLAFAVVAHVDAEVLIIDEALAVGDARFVQKCMRFLNAFRKRGTLLFVSHDTGAVLGLCARALWLDQGRMRALGPAKEVCEAYLSVYLGDNRERLAVAPASTTAETADQSQSARNKNDRIKSDRSQSDRGRLIPAGGRPVRDGRLAFLNHTNARNDIAVFAFDPEAVGTDAASFGAGGARIVALALTAEDGAPLAWTVGGEMVTLAIEVEALSPLARPIIGFFLKNKLGQTLFGDNTDDPAGEIPPPPAEAGDHLLARFTFQMPILPTGDYAVTAAVADGDQVDHVQHHWLNDGLVIRAQIGSGKYGLVGLPMQSVSLECVPPSGLQRRN